MNYSRTLSIILSLILCISSANTANGQPKVKDSTYGKVIGIADGDTFTLLVQGNIQEKSDYTELTVQRKANLLGKPLRSN
jgi:hypothetical protein